MPRDERGFTLAEVLIALALISIVFAGIYFFSLPGQRLYYRGSTQVELHESLRLVAERIIRELRFAREVELLPSGWDPASASTEEYSYIYFDAAKRMVILLDSAGARPLSDPLVSALIFSDKGSILLFTLTGESRGHVFTLESSVKPLNVSGNITGPPEGTALRFSLPS